MKRAIDAIQFFEQDCRQIADFIFRHNLLFKVDFDVMYHTQVHDFAEVSIKEPLPYRVILSMDDPVLGRVYFNQGDGLVVDVGEPKMLIPLWIVRALPEEVQIVGECIDGRKTSVITKNFKDCDSSGGCIAYLI